jgi:CDP-diacylglycerol--glycerol-3-phosphate 3-phosphatidyltransferase
MPNTPNLLSGFRIAMVPVLLWLAWNGHETVFLIGLAASLFSDMADGFVARRFGQATELGAKLDSWGDLLTYMVLPFCAWWLWQERVLRESLFVLTGILAYTIPLGFAKYGRLTSYHTYAAKFSAVVMGLGLVLFLIFDIPWLFRAAILLLAAEAVEEIAMTAVLRGWRANVPGFLHALRLREGEGEGQD